MKQKKSGIIPVPRTKFPIIEKVYAREIIDSRGFPTIEVDVHTNAGVSRASVPSGASTGKREAFELRDGEKRYFGMGVKKAVNNVNKVIGPKLIGKDVRKQEEIDMLLCSLDRSFNKENLGANAILGVSMAVCKAGALEEKLPLYWYIARLAKQSKLKIPKPMAVMIEGGKHAENSTDFQEFMILPVGNSFCENIRMCAEIYHTLRDILKSKEYSTNVGFEGAFAPALNSDEKALSLITEAIEKAGYSNKVGIAIDCAASEVFKNGVYSLEKNSMKLNSSEMINLLEGWSRKYNICSIEDGLSQEDWKNWIDLNKKLGKTIQIVGDDLTVTNEILLEKAIELKAINSILIKLNQIGTVSETLKTIRLAKKNRIRTILSQRAGETEETFYSDFAVGTGVDQFKFGAPSRGERTCKYNQLLRIEEEV